MYYNIHVIYYILQKQYIYVYVSKNTGFRKMNNGFDPYLQSVNCNLYRLLNLSKPQFPHP